MCKFCASEAAGVPHAELVLAMVRPRDEVYSLKDSIADKARRDGETITLYVRDFTGIQINDALAEVATDERGFGWWAGLFVMTALWVALMSVVLYLPAHALRIGGAMFLVVMALRTGWAVWRELRNSPE